MSVELSWPQPNDCGVYSKSDAEIFNYQDSVLWVECCVIQVGADTWLQSASYAYHAAGFSSGSGTRGCFSPISRDRWGNDAKSRDEALERLRGRVISYVATGRHEKHSKAALAAWSAVEQWLFGVGRQVDMFG